MLGLLTGWSTIASAQTIGVPEVFPLENVRRGQTGYGLTTMSGTEPERFEFEVIGVAKNMIPKMDIILVKSDDPKLGVSGFWRGMSGSPLFIDGKLVCAFSYGWRFNTLAIGGCTPIEYMKREGFMAPRRTFDAAGTSGTAIKNGKKRAERSQPRARLRGKRQAPVVAATLGDWLRVAPERTVDSALRTLGEPRQPWLTQAPLPPAPPRAADRSGDSLVPAAVPLAMSGFSTGAFNLAKQLFADYPVEPMQAGGTGSRNAGPQAFELGSSIAVQLVRGDLGIAATGTVSYVDRNRVLGFGHPLFQAGEIYAPVAAAQVHTIIPSAMSAFVMASPLRELGSLVQDRQSTIMADTQLATRMIPFDMYIDAVDGRGKKQREEFHVEVVNSRFFTAPFAGISAMSAVARYLPDRERTTVHIDSTVHVRGYKPLNFVDYLYAENGAGSAIGGARGLRAIVVLLNNPFAPVEIERIELRAKIRYEVNFGRIEELRLPTQALQPGQRSHVDVVMTTYDGSNIVDRVPFDVPASLAGSIVRLEVSPGDSTPPDTAPPKSLDEMMDLLRKLLPGNVYAVTLHSPAEGVAIDGKLVRDLPPSAVDRLRPRSRTQMAGLYRPVARSVSPARRVVNGSKSLLVKIADR
ncbi:MAG: hypothetical protein AAGC55_02455 [Myxococcota bacterium]